jgi:hypothetical protein
MTPTALYVGMTVGRRAVVSFDVDLDTGCWQHGVPSGPLGGALAVWSLLLPGAEDHHGAHGVLSEPFDAGSELDLDPLGAFRTHATVCLIRTRH